MKSIVEKSLIGLFAALLTWTTLLYASDQAVHKPGADEIIKTMQEGNQRFVSGKAVHPHSDAVRLQLAGSSDQGNYAYATVISCSDSRVPVEAIFDAGVMDIFVVRIAGNVCNTDEIGSIEYGLAHVHTPLLVVLGHTQCGAVTAVAEAFSGHKHSLERNIPPLIESITPAVKRAFELHKDVHGKDIVPFAIEENVWEAVHNLFMKSPATRNLVRDGRVRVAGAIYDVSSGKVSWLDSVKINNILKQVEASPDKETAVYAID